VSRASIATVDLNADVGEGFDSEEMYAALTSVNVACGGHAGDRDSMHTAFRRARAAGVAVGAHPGYDDRAGFGRVENGAPPAAIHAAVARQLAELGGLAAGAGLPLAHVKPHGALYHRATVDPAVADAIVDAVAAYDAGLAVVGFPGSQLLRAAAKAGVATIAEAFADRRYGEDGRLVPRTRADALVGGEEAVGQALLLASAGAATICLHSDSPGAPALAVELRRALEGAGFVVAPCAPPGRVVALPEMRVVGAAMVEGGRVYLTRRSARMSMSGKWEFPGGKVESGESPAGALAREVREELGVAIEVGERIGRGTSLQARANGGLRIVLEVFAARRVDGEIRLTQHEEGGWFTAEELATLDWPEADLPILPALAFRLSQAP
jgi:UPF0271 protein